MRFRYVVLAWLGVALAPGGLGIAQAGAESFTDPTRINNPYLPITKFESCELRGESEGARTRGIKRLLDRTQPFRIDGRTVQAVVVEDRAFEDGELVERTLDYFLQGDSGTVYYAGEDVDNYDDGKIVDHDGSWRYGRDTNTLGVGMPPNPQVGSKWRFEDVPGITIEEDEVVERLASKKAGGKTYKDVLKVREHLVYENVTEYKYFARGFGVIAEESPDGSAVLVGCVLEDDEGDRDEDDTGTTPPGKDKDKDKGKGKGKGKKK